MPRFVSRQVISLCTVESVDPKLNVKKPPKTTATRAASHPYSRTVAIRRTRVGKGIFALKNFPESVVIGEILGEVIHDANYGSDYCMSIGDDQVLEPEAPFCFVNHSCEPNCEFDWFDLALSQGGPEKRRVFLISLREIRLGEELTIDYNWSASNAIPCRCGAPSCRGWIVDSDESGQLNLENRH